MSALVEAATSFVRQDAMLTMAVKYLPATAIGLARGLTGESFSPTDERVAQLSMTGALDLVADGEVPSGEQVASVVAHGRGVRFASAQNRQRDLIQSQAKIGSIAGESGSANRVGNDWAGLRQKREITDEKQELAELRQAAPDTPKYFAEAVAAVAVAFVTLADPGGGGGWPWRSLVGDGQGWTLAAAVVAGQGSA